MGSLRRSRAALGGSTGARRVRGSRPVSALYGTLSVVLLAAALVMALIVRPPPPPSIAELGPSPQEQIEEARENQAAGSGSGDLATGAEEKKQTKKSTQQGDPSATTTPPTTSSTKKVPSTRRCYGDPPRQTEDPHSPPCVFEIFKGNNGGDTAKGVSGTEIQVAMADCGYFDDTLTAFEALLEHFNRRYEFYGRRIALDVIKAKGQYCNHGEGTSPSQSQALADEVVSRQPFASLNRTLTVAERDFPRRLADAGIHWIDFWVPYHSSSLVDGWTWLAAPPNDVDQRVGGDFVCRALHDRPARHAGSAGLRERPRQFAVMALKFYEEDLYPDVSPLMSRLSGCGANAKDFELHARDNVATRRQMQQLQNENYTTIIPVGPVEASQRIMMLTPEFYEPEWFILDFGHTSHGEGFWDTPEGHSTWKAKDEAFGFTARVRVRSNEETPAFWALDDGGGNTPQQHLMVEPFYNKLLILASGIQGAGPKLTPESFRQALWETVWPNPNPSGPPHWQQRVSLGPGDFVFYDDYLLWWWNSEAPSQTSDGSARTQDGRGSFCYLNRGGRFAPGGLPGDADRRLFNTEQEPCR